MKKLTLAAAVAATMAMPATAASWGVARWGQIDGLYARSVVVGDINWDQLDDLVVLTKGSPDGMDKVQVYLQQPNGTLALNNSTLWSSAFEPSMVLADLDNDSQPEVLVGSGTGFDRISYNFGYGTFYANHFATTNGCAQVGAADLDGDHYRDVVCQSLSSGATVYYSDQRGGFPTSLDIATARIPGSTMTLADLTGDGKPDLLLSAPTMTGFLVYPQSGAGFGTATSYGPPSIAPIATSTVGDLDRDGRLEALVAADATSPDAAVWSYKRANDGTLGTPTATATLDHPSGIQVRDVNRDGVDDLLVASAASGDIGMHLNGGSAYASLGGSALFAGDSSSLAAGDLDNDGCTDIAYATSTGAIAIAYGTGCVRVRTHADFDGDGRSDLVWHNDATGAGTLWKAADSTRQQGLTRITDPAWRIVGSGDFNHDGHADLLWHHDVTGALVIWWNGNSATAKNLTRITDPAWRIVGIGDFDGDRADDILWRNTSTGHNAIWRSGDSTTQLGVGTVTDQAWAIVGVGDFDADGKDDILWRNAGTGANVIWRAGSYTRTLAVASNSDPNAHVWVGDFDGDRHADLLWAYGNGEYRIWLQPDGNRVQQNYPWPSADWHVVAVGDYDGNGTADLAWRNMRTGQDVVWRSASCWVSRVLTRVTDFNWVVVR